MKLKQLFLRYYRNYTNISVQFNNHLNIILGNNAQGKTNLIESIIFLSTTKSHRVSDETLLIKNEEPYFEINGQIETKNRHKQLRVVVSKNGKTLILNRDTISKVSDFIGNLNAILFCPDDLNLFSSTPKVRRRFIDLEIGKISKSYTKLLNNYQKILKMRNLTLKQEKKDDLYLQTLTEQLIDLEVVIIQQRYTFIKKLMEYANIYYQKFQNQGILECDYETIVDYSESLKNDLQQAYDYHLKKDFQLMSTQIGIHRDDFIYKLNGKKIIDYASQGQKRMILLSIKLGMIEMINDLQQDYPILILDDVFSELDQHHQNQLMEMIPKDVQTFITTCDMKMLEHKLNREFSLFEIIDGKLNGGTL